MLPRQHIQQDKSRFWSEDFDMDLLKILPGLRDDISFIAGCPLYTFGSLSREGMFSHPAVWNSDVGMSALFFVDEPQLIRDEHGWVSIGGCVTDDPVCEITALDAIRDCWCHNYTLHLEGRRVIASSLRFYNSHFYPLMAFRRGWKEVPDHDRIVNDVHGWAVQGARNIEVVVANHRTLGLRALREAAQ